jgi:hypothetical protein
LERSKKTTPRKNLGSRWISILRRGAHEQELMIFPAEEYDAGASLHVNNVLASQHIQCALMEKGRGTTLSILKFEM